MNIPFKMIKPVPRHLPMRAAVLCALILSFLAPIAGFAAASPQTDPSPARVALEAHISFREAAGLRADEDYVKSVDAEYPVDPAWGLPLTPEEQALMKKDADVQANLHTIDEYARNAPDSYAGLFRDKEHLVHVGFVRDAERHLDNLKALFKYPELLRLFTATYSKEQLDAAAADISADMAELREQGIMIYMVGTNIQDNLVDVTVASADDETVLLLENRYGPQVRVSAGGQPCTAEAKICPDGTAVGRTGPNCEFAPCPGTTTADLKPDESDNGSSGETGSQPADVILLLVAGVVTLVILGGLAVYFFRRGR